MKPNSFRAGSLRFLCIIGLAFSMAAQAGLPRAKSTVKSGDASAELAERIRRVEGGISLPLGEDGQPLQLSLKKLMEAFKVPGVSVAVIDMYKIAWAKGYGVREAGSSTPVTARTLFQAGSISKPVAATGALYLVERGQLSLDENVSKRLTTWKVPENEFTRDQKVTLRRLMSHSAGLTVHGFPGYAVNDPVPTLVEIFNGEKPANTAPIRVDFVPGTKMRYSGGGVTIEQQLMMDVTGKPFPQLMREIVLDKIGMRDSTYEQPLPPTRAAVAASGTRAEGASLPGKWHIYPEMAAAGLWTTPTDLAKFAIEIALSKHGKSNRVLSEAMTREMLTPQIERVGLGFFLGEKQNPDEFGHDGADEGFQAILIMWADSGQGAAIMANSDNGIRVANYLVESIAREYGWHYVPPKRSTGDLLALVARLNGPEAALKRYADFKKAGPSKYDLDEYTLNALGYALLQSGKAGEALQVFKMNVDEYPKSWNVYDSLGEAYMRTGQKELAIRSCEKSLEINPQNQHGIEMLKKLQGDK